MSARAYPTYKKSGLSWCSEIPSHWTIARGKALFSLAQRKPRIDDGIVTAFRDGQVTLRSNRRADGFTNALKEVGYQGVRVGDLVLHGMDAFAGAIGVSDSDGKCSPVYSCCIPSSFLCVEYYGKLLRAIALSGFIESLGKGVRERSTDFRWNDFSREFFPVPPESEQFAIASFLNRETGKIDALVAEQERLIALLKEERQAVISQAVTKGLDPNVPMKDSGVEWLGQVPSNWEMHRLSRCCDFLSGKAHEPFIDESGDVVCVTARYISTQGVEERHCTRNLSPARRGDILMVMSDLPNGRALARTFLVSDNKSYAINQRVCAIRPHNDSSAFLSYQLNRSQWLLSNDDGANQTHLSNDDIRKMPLLLPSFAEQSAIVVFLDKAMKQYSELIYIASQLIGLLRERRAAIISAAVTGKIDVRKQASTVADVE